MSSLRLALKQSLEESGGGKFFSGHGDKKKRKKKKTGTESAPSSNGEKSGTTSNSSNTFSLKGSKSGSQRKRGRPRKHSRAQSDESSRRNPHPEDEDGEFSSENEFSLEYSEGETEEYDDDSDDDEVEDSDEDDDDEVHRRHRHRRNRRRRSGRRREDEEEEFQDDDDDEDMEDETTQSEEDELHSRPPMEEKLTHSTGTPAHEAGTDTSALDPDRGKSQPPSGPDDGSAAEGMTQRPSDPSQGATNNPSDKSTAPDSSTSASNEDELRKKIKLLKLKKKLEQNHQNSAANKIQTQWKKAKDKAALAKGKPSGSSTAAGTETTPEPEQACTGESLDAAGNAASDSNTTADAEGGDTGPTTASSLSSKTSTGDKKESLDKASSNGAERTQSGSKPDTTATESASGAALHNTAAGDSGKPESADSDGDEDAQVEKAAKKKKKKNKAKEGSSSNSSNETAGVVPAPTREVVLWGKNISVKKARKAIEVGMRVKVRFATNGFKVKKDGRKVSKKIYYGGRVTAKSTLGTKIKIKYDDGTSELAKFPDKDVVVDAVGNGEHAVPADDFLPPEPVTPEEPKEITSREKPPSQDAGKETEEGEIPSTAPSDAIEDGEVEETDRKPIGGHAQRQIMEAREDKDDNTGDAPTTPPPEVSRTDDGGDERMPPAPSPEEGELSPGITVTKSGETDSQIQIQQQQQNSSILVESKPFASESQPVTRQKQPLAETSTSSNKDVVSVSAEAEKSQTTVLESPSKPRAPKKLSIRIPSLATIKAKSLSSPKSGSNSPTASSSNTASGNKMDNVLADTPEAKTMEKATSKRKRTSEVITPSTDDASTEAAPEPPVKRRIKVAIGKSSLHESDVFAASDVIVALSADDGSTKAKFPAVKEDGLEEMDLAPSAEETIGETKKKKKKAERAKSPRPKSPLAKPASSGQLVKNNSTEAAKDKPQIGSSRGSAFDKKSSKDDESKLKETSLVASSLAESRTRKAAVDAKEKMLARQKAKLAAKELKEKEDALPESGKKKKKRRRQEDVEEQKPDSETEQNDPEWVQCDSCMKWRVLPDNVKVSSLPELWYCHMNIYDKKRNNCEAQEQTSKEALKERKERKRRLKLKKRARREAEMAESKQVKKGKQQDEEMPMNAKKKSKLEKLNAEKQTPRSTSPKPGKTIKTKGATADSKRAIAEAKRANLEGGKKSKVKLEEASPTDSGSDTKKEGKKKGKKAKKEVQESSDIQDSETSADGKKRKRGRPARNQTTAVVPSTSNEKEDEDNVEWVQCDKCQKWRKLPAHISADELGQFWNCAMNTWNPDSASCEADEDKTDAHHQEVGVLEWQLRQTHAGKYSYRQMIFGPTARKSNRPPSEKARAAESLFVMPSNDETQYTKSSAFLPRVSNFNKNNATEEKTLNIFDVLGNSNLWDELKRIDPKPAKILSSNFANIPGYANTTKMIKTYECLTNEIKHAMQDVVLQTLEFGCLTADEVIGKAQWFPYEAGVSGGVKAYCNPEIIIHTLLDLVRDGIVEMNTVRDAYLPITEWIPKYRRVGTRRAIEAVEAIKASRCMKIAKPWKQRSNKPAEEWVTGVPRS